MQFDLYIFTLIFIINVSLEFYVFMNIKYMILPEMNIINYHPIGIKKKICLKNVHNKNLCNRG